MTIGIIVGMRAEAALLAPGALVACSGGVTTRAASLADFLLKAGAEGLISFGVAGGLAPNLPTGTLVIGSEVDLGGASLQSDPTWVKHLTNALPHAQCGPICGVSEAATSIAAKAALHAETGALAVDMESGAMAEICAAAGKPFAVLRAIADPAERAIPEFALKGLREDGRTNVLPVILGLLRQPSSLPALIGLARDSRAALSSLGSAARFLGPALGF